MFINKLTGRSKKASPNPASQPASTATSPSFTNQHFQISGKPTEDSPHQRLVSPFETYPPPTKPSSSADQGYYSSLGVRHHQSSSLLDQQYQGQTVDQDGKLTGSPPSSSSSGSLPQLVRTSNHPPPIDAGKNDRSSRRSSLKSRSRRIARVVVVVRSSLAAAPQLLALIGNRRFLRTTLSSRNAFKS